MANPEKVETVAELHEVFQKAKSAVLANYQGIDAVGITALRSHMRSCSVDFRVVKNTLARRAAKDTALEVLYEDFKGPVSLIVSFDDLVAPAKALADFAKSGAPKAPEVLCGVVEGKKVSPEEVKVLSELPSRDELISQMLSVFQGPTTNFAGVFSALLRKLVGTLEAVREKKASS
ncbi:MAG: 50S ribosomal protein L10 [Nitrospinae bacterium]|nr:50S ribosomal protein L10 [Nitrospinota bacterium]